MQLSKQSVYSSTLQNHDETQSEHTMGFKTQGTNNSRITASAIAVEFKYTNLKA